MSSSTLKDINVIIQQPEPPVLKHTHELIGILESVEPVGGGLVKVRIAGLERLVAEEMEGRLRGLVGKRTSILRVGDYWSAIEWKGWRS